MKIKNKGKVYPSPPSSSSSTTTSSGGDSLSVLKLLPASILVFISVLSIEDHEVLAYLISRSINTTATATTPATNASSSSLIRRKVSKKAAANGSNNNTHKPPVFDCDCFDCYTSYWFKWDSSPNRELIHQAIEAFEDHLTNGEGKKSKKNGKAKRRDKTARHFADKNQVVAVEDAEESSAAAVADAETTLPANDVAAARVTSPGTVEENEVVAEEEEEEEERVSSSAVASGCSHKGLARKVLPDVLGLLNSRLWSLWCPNA